MPHSSSRTTRLRITGMTCEHCVRTIEKSLNALAGVRARVDLDTGTALVEHPPETPSARLLEEVRAKGYGAEILTDTSGAPRLSGNGADGLHVAVVGSGAAAFACALRATREGARVTMIEEGTLGGTCVNVGCIPSKILVRAAEVAQTMRAHPFAGIAHPNPALERALLARQQAARVEELRRLKYEEVAAAEPRIRILHGRARFRAPTTLEITSDTGSPLLVEADRALVATGAEASVPPVPGLSTVPFWTSTEALAATEAPRRLLVLGGSAVGLELAQAFRRLGSEVTVIEREGRLLPREDEDLGRGLEAVLVREGLTILTGTETRGVVRDEASVRLLTSSGPLEGDRLLVATGRRPRTAGLGLEALGVRTTPGGAIVVDEYLRTSVTNLYAAGDCTTLPQFVYVAAASGTRAAASMLGHDEPLDLALVPSVVFTDPQVATVGLGEDEARARGFVPESRTLPLAEIPRALVGFQTDGFLRLVADRETGRLLGARILAPEAGEIVTAAAFAIRAKLTVDEIGGMFFPYLVMAEGLKLCAQTFRLDVRRLSCCAA